MWKSPRINQGKRKISETLRDNILLISFLSILLLSLKSKPETEPVRLYKSDLPRPRKRKEYRFGYRIRKFFQDKTRTIKNILRVIFSPAGLLIILLVLLFILIPVLIYTSGSLESTNYYNRGFV